MLPATQEFCKSCRMTVLVQMIFTEVFEQDRTSFLAEVLQLHYEMPTDSIFVLIMIQLN